MKLWEYEDLGADWSLAVRVLERYRKYETPESEKQFPQDDVAVV